MACERKVEARERHERSVRFGINSPPCNCGLLQSESRPARNHDCRSRARTGPICVAFAERCVEPKTNFGCFGIFLLEHVDRASSSSMLATRMAASGTSVMRSPVAAVAVCLSAARSFLQKSFRCARSATVFMFQVSRRCRSPHSTRNVGRVEAVIHVDASRVSRSCRSDGCLETGSAEKVAEHVGNSFTSIIVAYDCARGPHHSIAGAGRFAGSRRAAVRRP